MMITEYNEFLTFEHSGGQRKVSFQQPRKSWTITNYLQGRKILHPGHHARILIHNILLIGGAEKLILGVENIPGKIPVNFLLFTFNSAPPLALFIFVLSFTCLMRGFLWAPSMDTAHSDTGFPTSQAPTWSSTTCLAIHDKFRLFSSMIPSYLFGYRLQEFVL